MTRRNRVVLALLCALSLVAVAQLASSASAQDPMLLEQAIIYSGNDIGIRVHKTKANPPVGRIVVRVAGRWQEVDVQPSLSK